MRARSPSLNLAHSPIYVHDPELTTIGKIEQFELAFDTLTIALAAAKTSIESRISGGGNSTFQPSNGWMVARQRSRFDDFI